MAGTLARALAPLALPQAFRARDDRYIHGSIEVTLANYNRGWGCPSLRSPLYWYVNWGSCILMQPEQDRKYSEAIQARLDRLYIRDGRMDKTHPMHGTYTGLTAKYRGWG